MMQTNELASTSGIKFPAGFKLAALASLVTIVCIAAYVGLFWVSSDEALRAIGFLGLLIAWLTTIVVITVRARVSVASAGGINFGAGLKVAALASLAMIVCVAAYLGLMAESSDEYLRAVGSLGLLIVWLTTVVVITVRARVSPLWAVGGMLLGISCTPIIVIAYLVIYVALGGEFVMD